MGMRVRSGSILVISSGLAGLDEWLHRMRCVSWPGSGSPPAPRLSFIRRSFCLLTSSASGPDPDIGFATARYRSATQTGITESPRNVTVARHVPGPSCGFMGGTGSPGAGRKSQPAAERAPPGAFRKAVTRVTAGMRTQSGAMTAGILTRSVRIRPHGFQVRRLGRGWRGVCIEGPPGTMRASVRTDRAPARQRRSPACGRAADAGCGHVLQNWKHLHY